MNSTKSRIYVGQKVWLKSGSPEMIVVDIEWGRCVCAYPIEGEISEVSYRSVCLTNKKP